MTITVEIPDDLILDLAALPKDTIRQYVNSYAIAGLKEVVALGRAESEDLNAALSEGISQMEAGDGMPLEEYLVASRARRELRKAQRQTAISGG